MNEIKTARVNAGLTQKEAAEKCGVSLRTWQNWEQGRRTPPEYVLKSIIEKLMEVKKMSKYFINYNTGAGNEWVEGELDDAMKNADNGAAYTQQNIIIEDANGNEVARRNWYGTLSGIEECENPIRFGDFGFYGDWMIL